MAKELTVSGAHPAGEPAAGPPAAIEEPVALDSFAGRIEVQWAPDEAVTALGVAVARRLPDGPRPDPDVRASASGSSLRL